MRANTTRWHRFVVPPSVWLALEGLAMVGWVCVIGWGCFDVCALDLQLTGVPTSPSNLATFRQKAWNSRLNKRVAVSFGGNKREDSSCHRSSVRPCGLARYRSGAG